jgi:hypothetical protein
LDATCVDRFGFWERSKTAFHREGVGIEPVEESGFAEDTGVGVLGGMDMGIYETGKEKLPSFSNSN